MQNPWSVAFLCSALTLLGHARARAERVGQSFGEELCVDSSGRPFSAGCNGVKVSADGHFVVVRTGTALYWRNRFAGVVIYLGNGSAPQMSADGKTILWRSSSSTLRMYRISNTSTGAGAFSTINVPQATALELTAGNANSMSFDGRYIVFKDRPATTGTPSPQGFVYDRYLGTRRAVTLDNNGQFPPRDAFNGTVSAYLEISGNGEYAFWDSDGDSSANGSFPVASGVGRDVFRRNFRASSPTTTLVSGVASGSSFTCGEAYAPAVDATGNTLAFKTYRQCSGTGDTDERGNDILVRDLRGTSFDLASVAFDGTQSSADSDRPYVSADGRYVLFGGPDELSPPDRRGQSFAAYIRDRVLNTTTRISYGVSFTGTGGMFYYGWPGYPETISADGTLAVYSYQGTNAAGSRITLLTSYQNERYFADGPGVTATFRCTNASTQPDQNVYVLGSIGELGQWVRPLAIKLSRSATTIWSGSVRVPPNTSFEWKCIRRSDANEFWLNASERKPSDTTDPLYWSRGANFTGLTQASGTQTFSGGF